ncbi:hypothetical protein TNCT_700921 [Trichonephila clavata]|uniref:Uncharacterized protein n=1 Tax=Trichonephila clavata TaxID=2740835 RepID=A0A8X6G271_TRICU|nr:hypothetical protein TNCT_700921 [Trichonephila clavata]
MQVGFCLFATASILTIILNALRICLHGYVDPRRESKVITHGLPGESVPCRKPHLMHPIEASIAYPVSLHVLYPTRLDYSFCRGASPTPSLTSLKLPTIRFAFRNTRATGFTSLSTPPYYFGTLDLEEE